MHKHDGPRGDDEGELKLELLLPRRLFGLEGKVVLVTGASGWLGAPIALALASAGANVLAVGRGKHRLASLCDIAAAAGLQVSPMVADITDHSDVTALVRQISSSVGALDIVVNCASPAVDGSTGLDAKPESFAEATQGHVTPLWRIVQCARQMLVEAARERGDASVINVASMYGKVSPVPTIYSATGTAPNPPYYGAAKAAGLQLARWLAANLGPEGIRVNSVSPGPFPQGWARGSTSAFVSALAQRTMLGRVGDRHEVAGAVLFLASPASRYMTGADIAVDGGWTAW